MTSTDNYLLLAAAQGYNPEGFTALPLLAQPLIGPDTHTDTWADLYSVSYIVDQLTNTVMPN